MDEEEAARRYAAGEPVELDPAKMEQFRVGEAAPSAPLTDAEVAMIAEDDQRTAACPDCGDESIREDHVADVVALSNGWSRQLHK